MIKLCNVCTIKGEVRDITINSAQELTIDATGLTLFPGLIDPHVHFRTPGQEYKEDWRTAALAAVCGGYTTVFDMPNNVPACVTYERLLDKKQLIERQLAEVKIPLHYQLYFGADKNHFHEIPAIKHDVVGIKVFMGSSTGDLLMDDDSSLHAIFALACAHDLLIATHAEDECLIQSRRQQFSTERDPAIHSVIRSPEVAAVAVEKALALAKLYKTRLYILHVSTQQELALIAQAKRDGVHVYAEVCPHHLFLNTAAYAHLGTRAQMNPPLRDRIHQECLFAAIHEGVIDMVGSDHAPHTAAEKDQPYRQAPSGVAGIETTFPLLLNAYNEGLLSLAEIVSLTSERAKTIFTGIHHDDWVLADLNRVKKVDNAKLKTKCAWSPYHGMTLTGWPRYTILHGQVFDVEKLCG